MDSQKELIRAFIMEPSWCIVILDACRHDYFTEYMEAESVRSPALSTPMWIKRVWGATYDASYISGTPWIRKTYNSKRHFNNVVDVWDFGWKNNTVPPENMVKAVENNLADKMIVHVIQPHMPYMELDIDQKDLGKGPKVKDVAKQIGDEKLREAYRSNLELGIKDGLNPIVDICKDRGQPVAITADHGELLGEDGLYGHNRPDHKILRKVPWREFNVDRN